MWATAACLSVLTCVLSLSTVWDGNRLSGHQDRLANGDRDHVLAGAVLVFERFTFAGYRHIGLDVDRVRVAVFVVTVVCYSD